MITLNNYKAAYRYGKKQEFTAWYTGALEAAYDLGYAGIEIEWDQLPIVTGYRYGAAPENSRSYNYAEGRAEYGISMAWVEGMEDEIASSVWFSDRQKVEITGYLLPVVGSDGEPLILPINIEQYDF